MSRDPMDEWIDQACEADAQDIDIDEFDDLPASPPLSIEEIGQAHADLARCQTPEAFKALVDGLCARCTSKDWFNSPRLKFLHDAFVLARFARAKAAQSVRLAGAAEPWPDGFVRLNGTGAQYRSDEHAWRTAALATNIAKSRYLRPALSVAWVRP